MSIKKGHIFSFIRVYTAGQKFGYTCLCMSPFNSPGSFFDMNQLYIYSLVITYIKYLKIFPISNKRSLIKGFTEISRVGMMQICKYISALSQEWIRCKYLHTINKLVERMVQLIKMVIKVKDAFFFTKRKFNSFFLLKMC